MDQGLDTSARDKLTNALKDLIIMPIDKMKGLVIDLLGQSNEVMKSAKNTLAA